MTKQVIPSIHIPIQEKDGSISWVWYMFLKYLSSVEGGSGASSLSQLSDVNISSPTNNQYLVYDNGIWKNQTLSISWGQIGGDIEDQTDLKNALDSKQGVLTAGTNITIDENNVISATGDSLPDQTGNAGKILITDGTNVSWTDNYLPLSGGTMTGIITYATSGTTGDTATKILSNTDNRDLIRAGAFGSMWVGSGTTYIANPCPTASGNALGSNIMPWGTVYARRLNRGTSSADILIPNQAGTMLVNRTTATNSISVGGSTSSVQAVQFGALGSAGSMATSYGFSTYATGVQAIAIGHGSQATASKSYAFGEQAISSAIGAFQFGQATNSEAGTVCFALTTDGNTTVNYKLLDSYGLIPGARLADTTSATQGQVLTLDSNLKPTWTDASSGSGYHPDLFDWKWADHQLDDVQWLRADTFSWQSGSVYESAYQHLVDDLGITQTTYYAWYDSGGDVRYYTLSETPSANDALYQEVSGSMVEVSSEYVVLSSYDSSTTPPRIRVWTLGGTESYYRDTSNDITISRAQTETIAGVTITYYPSADGHKIVLPDQENNVTAIYNATGVAWYYILDTTNERFKLPRTKFGVTGLRDTVGNYVEPELPNIVARLGGTISWARDNPFYGSGNTGSCSGSNYGMQNTMMDLSRVNSIFKNGATVQPPATQMYLYFYVGEFTQAAIENTAGVVTEDFNELNAHKVIAFQAPNAGNNYTWYRKYADGWVEQGGTYGGSQNQTISLLVEMADNKYSLMLSFSTTSGNAPVYSSYAYRDKTTTSFVAINSGSINGDWQVSGMAAS